MGRSRDERRQIAQFHFWLTEKTIQFRLTLRSADVVSNRSDERHRIVRDLLIWLTGKYLRNISKNAATLLVGSLYGKAAVI